METVRLDRTGLIVSKNGFGALPIQRVGREEAARMASFACLFWMVICGGCSASGRQFCH